MRISLLAPQAELRIRPRFYEPDVHTMLAPLDALFDAVGVTFVQGAADSIDATNKQVTYRNAAGIPSTLAYDRLVMAAGSRLNRPGMDGIEQVFDVDQIEDAAHLEAHINALKNLPRQPGPQYRGGGRRRLYRYRDRHRNAGAPACGTG